MRHLRLCDTWGCRGIESCRGVLGARREPASAVEGGPTIPRPFTPPLTGDTKRTPVAGCSNVGGERVKSTTRTGVRRHRPGDKGQPYFPFPAGAVAKRQRRLFDFQAIPIALYGVNSRVAADRTPPNRGSASKAAFAHRTIAERISPGTSSAGVDRVNTICSSPPGQPPAGAATVDGVPGSPAATGAIGVNPGNVNQPAAI